MPDASGNLHPVDTAAVRALAVRLKRSAGDAVGDFVFVTISDGGAIQHYPEPNGGDAVERMVALMEKIGAQHAQNTYFCASLFRSGAIVGNTGRTKKNVVLVLGAVCDFDAKNDPKTRLARLPLPPNAEVETSAGNIQSHFWFDPPLKPGAETDKLLAVLADVSGADDCQTSEHLWRCPGTWNWPNRKKIIAGRDPKPFAARWEIGPKPGLDSIAPEELRAAILKRNPSAFDQAHEKSASTFDAEWRRWPGKPPVAVPEKWLAQVLNAPLEGREDRSTRLRSVQKQLINRNFSLGEIVALLEEHEGALAVKGTGKWLQDDVQRAREDWEQHPEYQDQDPPRDERTAEEAFGNSDAFNEQMREGEEGEEDEDDDPDLTGDKTRQEELRRRFRIEDRADFRGTKPKGLLIPALAMPRVGVGSLIAYFKSCKGFLALDLMAAVATDLPAFDMYPARKKGVAIYCAGEGQDGIKTQRIPAWEKVRKHNLDGKVFLMPAVPEAMLAEQCKAVRANIRQWIKDHPGETLRQIWFDTYNRMLPGQNENDAGVAAIAMRFAQSLVDEFSIFVGVVHHMGKDRSKGARGTTAFTAAADWEMECVEKLPDPEDKTPRPADHPIIAHYRVQQVKDNQTGIDVYVELVRVPLDDIEDDDGEKITGRSSLVPNRVSRERYEELAKGLRQDTDKLAKEGLEEILPLMVGSILKGDDVNWKPISTRDLIRLLKERDDGAQLAGKGNAVLWKLLTGRRGGPKLAERLQQFILPREDGDEYLWWHPSAESGRGAHGAKHFVHEGGGDE